MNKNKFLAILMSGVTAMASIPAISAFADEAHLGYKMDWDYMEKYAGGYDNYVNEVLSNYTHDDGQILFNFTKDDRYWAGRVGYILNDVKKELYTNYKLGDIDMDGVVTEHDLSILLNAFFVPKTEPKPTFSPTTIVGIFNPEYLESEEDKTADLFKQLYLADMNLDGIVDEEDIDILNHLIEYKVGDVNQDGEVTVDDASLILNEYAKKSAGLEETFTEEQKNLSDIDGKRCKINADKVDYATVDNASSVLERYARQAAGLPAIEGDSVLVDYLG
ncbi:MAG: hypothetical protein IJZ64_04610 [Ruminococcus sp.]|nr:hypothetical protein [Ruminococcus sp.]